MSIVADNTVKNQAELRKIEQSVEEFFLIRKDETSNKYYHIIMTKTQYKTFKIWAFWAKQGFEAKKMIKASAMTVEHAHELLHKLLRSKVCRSNKPYRIVNHQVA